MTASLWPMRGFGPPLATLALQATAGAALYGLLAVAFDIAGLRRSLASRLGGRNPHAPCPGPNG